MDERFRKCYFCVHSVEKDGSPLSDERQTVQISLFALLKDLLKSPTAEELHSVLAYAAIVQDEQQVTHTNTKKIMFQNLVCSFWEKKSCR